MVIKLTTAWPNLDYAAQSPGRSATWQGHRFEINNDADEADYWFVWGGLPPGKSLARVRVPKEHLVYVTDEAHEKRHFNQAFLRQFGAILTPRQDLALPTARPWLELAPWYLPASYDELAALPLPTKTRPFSVITSDLLYLDGHKRRFAFVNQLKGHFKDRLDVFGRGIRPIDDKFEAYLPYAYVIALENSSIPDYITEKIREPFLAWAMPAYWGAPNVADYFDPDSFIALDIDDIAASAERLEEAIVKDFRNQRLDLIAQMRRRCLDEYGIFPSLLAFIERHLSAPATSTNSQTITSEAVLWKQDNVWWRKALGQNPITQILRRWSGQ